MQLGEIPAFAGMRINTPTLQHSSTPALQHSNTPALQHSSTPTLHIPLSYHMSMWYESGMIAV